MPWWFLAVLAIFLQLQMLMALDLRRRSARKAAFRDCFGKLSLFASPPDWRAEPESADFMTCLTLYRFLLALMGLPLAFGAAAAIG